jgi:hypothetical protein
MSITPERERVKPGNELEQDSGRIVVIYNNASTPESIY